jgi:hypothetical protein
VIAYDREFFDWDLPVTSGKRAVRLGEASRDCRDEVKTPGALLDDRAFGFWQS